MSTFNRWYEHAKVIVTKRIGVISSETMAWLANIMLHAATIPSLIAVSMSLTDRLPSVDLVLLTWGALSLLFLKAVIVKEITTRAFFIFAFQSVCIK